MPCALASPLRVVALVAVLAALPARAAELVVQWAPLTVPVEGYQVERRSEDASEPFKPIGRVNAEVTRFVDRAVSPGVRYCYRVRGVRGSRTSPPSPPLCNLAGEAPVQVEAPAPAESPEPEVQPAPSLPRGEDREVRALRRPPPRYPPYAQLNGISGWVKLLFTVTASGTTRDVRVVASEPPGVFDAAALDAAGRFLYAPRLENGVPVDRPNVETEITFTWIDRGGSLSTDRRSPVPR